jgi:hypothetical protein
MAVEVVRAQMLAATRAGNSSIARDTVFSQLVRDLLSDRIFIPSGA